jgi:hypothetical protein
MCRCVDCVDVSLLVDTVGRLDLQILKEREREREQMGRMRVFS